MIHYISKWWRKSETEVILKDAQVSRAPLSCFADIENTYKVMGELDKLSKTVKDILDCRIEAVLQDMSVTALCDLPEDEPVTMDKFLELTASAVDSASKQLAK